MELVFIFLQFSINRQSLRDAYNMIPYKNAPYVNHLEFSITKKAQSRKSRLGFDSIK
jgi:hypothetical protein